MHNPFGFSKSGSYRSLPTEFGNEYISSALERPPRQYTYILAQGRSVGTKDFEAATFSTADARTCRWTAEEEEQQQRCFGVSVRDIQRRQQSPLPDTLDNPETW